MLFGLFRQLWLPCAILFAKTASFGGLAEKIAAAEMLGATNWPPLLLEAGTQRTPLGRNIAGPTELSIVDHRRLHSGRQNKLHCCTGALEALRFSIHEGPRRLTCPLHRSFQIPTICIRQKRHSLMGTHDQSHGGPMLSLCSRNSTGQPWAGRRSQLPGRLNVRGGALREEVNEV